MQYAAFLIYILAIVAANTSVAVFGPAITPINAFIFIGLDLSLRDWLHLRLSKLEMLSLILVACAASYAVNPAAGTIAVASAIAFLLSAFADWIAFQALSGKTYRVRSNGSNLVGAAVDSLVFPTLAFGSLMPAIVLGQFVAKVVGGAVWTEVVERFTRNFKKESTNG